MNQDKVLCAAQANLDAAIDDFVSRLETTYRTARAPDAIGGMAARRDLAKLRRALHGRAVQGRSLDAPLHRYVAPSLSRLSEAQQERVARWFYTVGSLFALHPHSLPEKHREDGNLTFGRTSFGKTCGQLYLTTPSFEARFIALLSSDAGEAPIHLRQLTNILRTQNQPLRVNWRLLLADLLRWNGDGGYVQRRWGRHFYGAANLGKKSGPEQDDTSDELADETAAATEG